MEEPDAYDEDEALEPTDKIQEELQEFTVACTTRITEDEFDNALFMITPNTTTGELTLDLLENIHNVLKIKGKCLIAYDGESHSLTTQLKSVFGLVQTLGQSRKGGTIFLATKKSELEKPRNFLAKFETSLPGIEKISLESLPGIFCHRRPDNGGLALAEIASTMLESKMRVMDMGCGCGIVGLLLAQKEADIELTFIDSSVRALDATNRNIKELALSSTELILSDNGTSKTGYDMFVGNPPYYSDYRIAEVFIDQAYDSLKDGGIALIVTKQTTKVGDLMYEVFGNIDIIPRRGYSVITAKR
jgi:16S rRNA G1207 methylase RsmC